MLFRSSDNKLNEQFPGDLSDVGIILQGGLYNTVLRVMQRVGLADTFGNSRIPIYCMNVTYPMVPDEVTQFCAGKRAVLMMEEGHPDYIEQMLKAIVGIEICVTRISGKWKTSQNRPAHDRAGVSAALRASGDANAIAMADAVDGASKPPA